MVKMIESQTEVEVQWTNGGQNEVVNRVIDHQRKMAKRRSKRNGQMAINGQTARSGRATLSALFARTRREHMDSTAALIQRRC